MALALASFHGANGRWRLRKRPDEQTNKLAPALQQARSTQGDLRVSDPDAFFIMSS